MSDAVLTDAAGPRGVVTADGEAAFRHPSNRTAEDGDPSPGDPSPGVLPLAFGELSHRLPSIACAPRRIRFCSTCKNHFRQDFFCLKAYSVAELMFRIVSPSARGGVGGGGGEWLFSWFYFGLDAAPLAQSGAFPAPSCFLS